MSYATVTSTLDKRGVLPLATLWEIMGGTELIGKIPATSRRILPAKMKEPMALATFVASITLKPSEKSAMTEEIKRASSDEKDPAALSLVIDANDRMALKTTEGKEWLKELRATLCKQEVELHVIYSRHLLPGTVHFVHRIVPSM